MTTTSFEGHKWVACDRTLEKLGVDLRFLQSGRPDLNRRPPARKAGQASLAQAASQAGNRSHAAAGVLTRLRQASSPPAAGVSSKPDILAAVLFAALAPFGTPGLRRAGPSALEPGPRVPHESHT